METLTDEQLIQKYLRGDEAALRVLFARYLKPVYNFVYHYIDNQGDVEDITQDVFVSAWKNLKKFDQTKKFKTWIFTIAKNASLNWLKKKKPALFSEFSARGGSAFGGEEEENVLIESFRDPAPLPDELFSQKQSAEKLAFAAEKLSFNYQTILSLRYNDRFTFQEIADFLGESLNTIKSRHRRALIKLRNLLEF